MTGIERTLIDLASVTSPKVTGLALDDALRQRLTTLDQMYGALETLGSRGRAGAATIRKLLNRRDERDALTESRLEASLLKLLRANGLSLPIPQHRVLDEGRAVARLDFAYPAVRIGIEVDGYRWHGGRERWARDLRRENALKLLGWTLLRFSWEDVKDRQEVVVAQVRQALGRSSAASVAIGPSTELSG